MALINCPECQKEVSDTVKACPNCGAQVQKLIKQKIKAEKRVIAKQRNKKALKVLAGVFAFAFLWSLFTAANDHAEKNQTQTATAPKPVPKANPKHLSTVDIAFVCKATVASQMGKDIKIMHSAKADSKYYVTYVRPDDGTKWGIYCWTQGNRVLWQTDGRNNTSNDGRPGRVRDNEYDDYITFSVQGNTLILSTKSYGSSPRLEKFPIPKNKK